MGSWVVLGINLVIVVIVVVSLRGFVLRRTSQQAALDDIKQEVGSIVTELNQTTERNIELIEDRIKQLNELLDAADRRVKVLKRHQASADVSESNYRKLASRRPIPSAPVYNDATGPSEAGSEPEAPLDQSEATPELVVVPSVAPEPEVTPRERVRALYLRGIPLERIASLTGHTVGEVELMISLDEGQGV